MARKSGSARKSGGMSTLVRAEEAAEEEILETPALSSFASESAAVDEEESEDEEDEEDEIERRLVAEAQAEAAAKDAPEKKGVYNREALNALVAEWDADAGRKTLPWVETLETCEVPLELESVHDDLKREVAFYNNSLASVRLAKARLAREGVAYKRPDDYFAEMLKSDAHMAKVKDKLIYEQKKITAVEERKKSQAHRKVAKEVQAQKVKERNQEKKDTLEAVKQWKKRKAGDKSGLKDDDDQHLDSIMSGKGDVNAGDKRSSKKPRVNKAREARDAKYGFGGKRRHAKSNTKESSNDMSGFPGARSKAIKARIKAQGASKGGKRAGKAQRDSQRNKNRR